MTQTVIDDIVAANTSSPAEFALMMSMLYDDPVGPGRSPGRPRGQRAKCGTERAYKQHLYYKEPTCNECRRAHADRVAADRLAKYGPPEPQEYRCGTTRGYRRHLRVGEPTCADCRAANRECKRQYEAGGTKRRTGVS